MNRKLIVIAGPTASGKTALSIRLAKLLDGEVVSADSMQIYRGMDIGTAKPTAEEMEGVPHHMLSVCDPGEEYSVSRYAQEADACVQDILGRGKTVILCEFYDEVACGLFISGSSGNHGQFVEPETMAFVQIKFHSVLPSFKLKNNCKLRQPE